jgi:HAD superfamily hydrolase (TIGR01509 family)
MAQALIFDCDGTIADSMPAHYRAWLAALGPYGIPFPEAQFYELGGVPTMEIFRILTTAAGVTADLAVMQKAKEEAFLTYISTVVAVPKVLEVARAHRGVVPMAVASGGVRRVVEPTLRQLGIFDWFSAVITAEDTTRHKPEPDVFLEAARRMGVPPVGCVVYEDTDLGLEAARRAGMSFVDVRTL